MSLEEIIESPIQEAMEAGVFDRLPGRGRPLPDTEHEKLAGENWLGYKALQNGGLLPEWLELAREIEDMQRRLDAIDARHAEWIELGRATGDWPRYLPMVARTRAAYEELGRELRKKQDRFNISAPGILSERPAIWLELHLRRLDARLMDAGAPDQNPADSN